MAQSFNDLPDFVELYPDADGGFSPDFNRPAPGPAPIAPYVSPESLPIYREQPEPPPPRPPQPTTGAGRMSDADIADFGTDEYGRPVVTRDPDGRPRFNNEGGFTPDELRRADRALDDIPDTRGARTGLGRAARSGFGRGARRVGGLVPFLGTALDVADIGIELGRAFGWWGQPDAQGQPGGDVTIPGAGGYPVGQCEGVLYGVTINFLTLAGNVGQQSGSYSGPIGGAFVVPGSNLPYITAGNPAVPYSVGSASPQVPPVDRIINVNVARLDGQPDVCGQLLPGQGPSNPPTTNPDPFAPNFPNPFPNPFGRPFPDANGDGIPDYGLDPFGNPLLRPRPFPYPFPDLNGDGYPDVLPVGPPALPPSPPDTDYPDPPTPDDGCCPGSTLSLAEIKLMLARALAKLEGKGKGVFDLAPCESEIDPLDPPDPLAGLYEGEGLTGVYAAIAQITKSLNLVRSDTKCLEVEGSNAALPMHFEAKHGEIPQLVVIWRKIDGGGSTWSMTIPHPRDDIGPNYVFSFPEYKKGGNMASLRLADNSQVIVNVFSEPEAEKILDYITTLIDPDYIPETGMKMVYSQNVAEYAEVEIRAQYVKKYAGHKTAAPLWGRHIPS